MLNGYSIFWAKFKAHRLFLRFSFRPLVRFLTPPLLYFHFFILSTFAFKNQAITQEIRLWQKHFPNYQLQTSHERGNVSHVSGYISSICLVNSPQATFGKGSPLQKKPGRRLDKPFVCHNENRPIRFLHYPCSQSLTARRVLLQLLTFVSTKQLSTQSSLIGPVTFQPGEEESGWAFSKWICNIWVLESQRFSCLTMLTNRCHLAVSNRSLRVLSADHEISNKAHILWIFFFSW